MAAVLARMGWWDGAVHSGEGGGLAWRAFRRWRAKDEPAAADWWADAEGWRAAALRAGMPAARRCWVAVRRLADSPRFENAVLGAVFCSVLLLAADHQPDSLVGRRWSSARGYLNWVAGLDAFNLLFNCFFIFDLSVKVGLAAAAAALDLSPPPPSLSLCFSLSVSLSLSLSVSLCLSLSLAPPPSPSPSLSLSLSPSSPSLLQVWSSVCQEPPSRSACLPACPSRLHGAPPCLACVDTLSACMDI